MRRYQDLFLIILFKTEEKYINVGMDMGRCDNVEEKAFAKLIIYLNR